MGMGGAMGMSVQVPTKAIDEQCAFHCTFLVEALERCRAYEFRDLERPALALGI